MLIVHVVPLLMPNNNIRWILIKALASAEALVEGRAVIRDENHYVCAPLSLLHPPPPIMIVVLLKHFVGSCVHSAFSIKLYVDDGCTAHSKGDK